MATKVNITGTITVWGTHNPEAALQIVRQSLSNEFGSESKGIEVSLSQNEVEGQLALPFPT